MTGDSANSAGVLFFFALYFLPTIIAVLRWRINTAAIFALNLLLGWTLLGWVVAIVWSLAADPSRIDSTSGRQARAKHEPVLEHASADKVCPRCAEKIKAAAVVCRFCGHEFEPVRPGS